MYNRNIVTFCRKKCHLDDNLHKNHIAMGVENGLIRIAYTCVNNKYSLILQN